MAKQLSVTPSHLSGILDIQMLQCFNRDVRDTLTHRKYLGVMSAAVDKAHYTNRCVTRTVQNALAFPIFALYFQHSVKYSILRLHEKHVVATWNHGNHFSICLQTQGNQGNPVSRWPVAGPSEY